MPNIAVTNLCNLNCPYCFADNFITQDKIQYITQDQLTKIIQFLKQGEPERIGLIGGEPTLHPKLSSIIEYISDEYLYQYPELSMVIFTNGINLTPYIRYIKNNITLLININSPKVISETQYNKIIQNLKLLQTNNSLNNVSIGINLYLDMPDFDYIFHLAHQFNFNEIRISCVCPIQYNYNTNTKENYYTAFKPLFLKVLNKAFAENIRLNLDCNKIPLCYFTKTEKELINYICTGQDNTWCNPVVDITPDFKCTSCFGAYNLIDLNQFNTLQEVERYLLFTENYPRYLLNNSGKCNNCSQYKKLICQGGCLSFANSEV